jgi:hypothetical protein
MTQYFPNEDPLNDAARRHYGSSKSQLLRQVLDAARQGTLTATWREALQPPTYSLPAHRIYTDGDFLAVEELREMAPAPWEPGHPAGWRDALDAWYLAYRTLLIEQAVGTQQKLARSLETQTATLNTKYTVMAGRTTTTLAQELRGTLSDFDHNSDVARRQFDDFYVTERDRLGASYLAGLAAGGDDAGWVEWFEARVANWNDAQAAELARAQIAAPAFRAQWERLPSYWTGEPAPT